MTSLSITILTAIISTTFFLGIVGVDAVCFCDTNAAMNASLYTLGASTKAIGWTSSTSMCTWAGVSCSTALTSLILCSSGACTSGGSLPNTNSSTLWQTIGSSLTSLTIYGNYGLVGSFPSVASTSLISLKTLLFSSYSPTGSMVLPSGSGYAMTLYYSVITIASSSSASANITSLSISYTTAPDLSNILNLKSFTALSSTVKGSNWTAMTGLTSFFMNYGDAAGSLSNWSGIHFPVLSSMTLISVSGVSLLPASWSSITSLTAISIFSTTLSTGATIPASWTSLPNLTSLVISNCGLSRPLPSLALDEWSRLETIDLSNNNINSTLPSDWAGMNRLTTLTCWVCNLIGPLPPWGAMSSLQTISMAGNTFNDFIPTSWGLIPSLATLALNSSQIVGDLAFLFVSNSAFLSLNLSNNQIGPLCNFTVPASIKSLLLNDNLCTGEHPNWTSATSVTVIDLSGNAFTGSLATIPSTKLVALRVDRGNLFTGSLPIWATATSITEIAADNNNFSGTIPGFSTAVNLVRLQLGNSNLSGALPTSLRLTNVLVNLNLANNNFTGTFPSFTGSPTALVNFDLSNNNFSGTFPSFTASPTALVNFDLSNNNFTGAFPSLSSARRLSTLNVRFNRLTGSLRLYALSTAVLLTVDVACNSLSGTVSSWISSWNLRNVNLTCGNTFSGSIPQIASTSLVALDLSGLGLTGAVSSVLGGSSIVTSMLLGGNVFSGTMPQFLQWASLQQFNVSGNSLTGSIIVNSGTFPVNLTLIDLSNNSALTGTVPVPLAPMPRMQYFLLGGDAHAFSGSLPSLNTIFPNLVRLSLSGSFPVAMPNAWLEGSTAWGNLTTLSLRKCGFSGTLPTLLASTNLTLLDLSRNQLSGTFPSSLATAQLTVLDVSSNQLSGTLPADLDAASPLLTVLSFGANNFVGELPSSWSNLTLLSTLDVSSCNLNGTLPAELVSLNSLQILKINSNNFSSSATDSALWVAVGVKLRQLDMSSNNFTTPPQFSNNSTLTMLNVSSNNFSTSLPTSWSTTLPSLTALNASNNCLNGDIPKEWSFNSTLTSLDLGNNFLRVSSLPLASLLTLLPSLRILILQQNNISTSLAKTLVLSSQMQVLDLSHNTLSGGLPPNFLSLVAGTLTSLQLQGNFFSGSLPKSWGLRSMTQLRLLNISQNKITGMLPYNWGGLFRSSVADLCNNSVCGPAPLTLNTVPNIGFNRCPNFLKDAEACTNLSTSLQVTATQSSSEEHSQTLSLSTTYFPASGTDTTTHSATASYSVSQSDDRSVSPSCTLTPKVSRSLLSASLTGSPTLSPSLHVTPTRRVTVTAASLSTTFSVSTTSSQIVTASRLSSSVTLSQSKSTSKEITFTVTPSWRSDTLPPSLSPSVTKSNPSISRTSTVAVTASAMTLSPSRTKTVSDSRNATRTGPSLSISGTATTTMMFTVSVALLPTVSNQPTASMFRGSVSKTISVTYTKSRSPPTKSRSTSHTETNSIISTNSSTRSASASHALSATNTASPSPTTSPSPSAKLSASKSAPTPTATSTITFLSNTSKLTGTRTTSISFASSFSVSVSDAISTSTTLSQWDCNALNDTEVFLGLGHVNGTTVNTSMIAAGGTAAAGRRYLSVAPTQPPDNPTSTGIVAGTTITKVITTIAQPLDRHQLMDEPTALVVNITVTSDFANMWAVGGATLSGKPLQWQSTKAVTATWHLILLYPPDEGWVGPGGLSLFFLDRTLEIDITMTCGYVPFLVVTITAHSPLVPRNLAETVATATQSSQVASIFAGGVSSGAALARVMSVRSMVVCDANSAVNNGVVDPGFVLCPSTTDVATTTARSAIATNFAFVVFVTLLLVAIAGVWAYVRSKPLRGALRTVALPSSLMTAAMAIIPSSMSGAALLATRYDTSPCDALDAFLIAIGMLESVAPLLFVLRLWARKARGTSPSWVCASTPIEVPPQEEHGRVYTAMRSFVYHTVRRSWKWYRVRHPASGTPQSAQVLLLEYRVLWYPSLDASIVTGVALLTVVGGLNHESPFLCRGSTVLVIFLLLGQLTVIPFFQPFTTRVSHIAAMANAILTTASVVLQFVIVASSHSSVLWLDTASSICNLIVLAISATRMCLDAYDVMFAIKKRVGTTIEKDRTHDVPKLLQQVDEGDTTTLEMCFQATNHEIEENRRDVGGVKDAFELDLDACMDMLMDTAEANDKRGDNEKSFELPPQDDSAFSLLWDDVDTVADATKCHHQNMGEVWSHIRQQARADQGDDSIVEERAHLSFWDKSGRALDAVAAAGSSGNKSGNKRTDGAEEELPSIIASTDTAIRRVTPASRNETENPSSSSSRKEDPGKIGNATRRRGSFRRK